MHARTRKCPLAVNCIFSYYWVIGLARPKVATQAPRSGFSERLTAKREKQVAVPYSALVANTSFRNQTSFRNTKGPARFVLGLCFPIQTTGLNAVFQLFQSVNYTWAAFDR